MTMTFKTIVSTSIFLLNISSVFSYNPSTLDDISSTCNSYIWSQQKISIPLIQNNLHFLEDDDKDIVEKYSSTTIDSFKEKVNSLKDSFNEDCYKNLVTFFNNCEEIYTLYEDFYKIPQVAVLMLFERVLNKYQVHESDLRNYYTARQRLDMSLKTQKENPDQVSLPSSSLKKTNTSHKRKRTRTKSMASNQRSFSSSEKHRKTDSAPHYIQSATHV